MKKLLLIILFIFIALVIIDNSDKDNQDITSDITSDIDMENEVNTNIEQGNDENSAWKNINGNPVINYGDTINGILWGDVSVIKDGDLYKMWMSGGKPFETPLVVKIYYATSKDGIDWDINKNPVFESEDDSWDSSSVETPSVIKVGDTYHMYYTGYDGNFKTGIYSIGHATSSDGIVWKRDSNNPIVTPHDDPLKWGHYTTAEPGIVYHNNKFYLYYASAKSNYPTGPGTGFGIMVATSTDGSNFTNNQIAHSISSRYDKTKYRGYSTPSVYVENNIFYLYHDIVYNLDGFEQIGISSAVSKNGFDFKELDVEIIGKTDTGWKSESVLAPSVIWDNGVEKMWFTGYQSKPKYDFGVGYIYK